MACASQPPTALMFHISYSAVSLTHGH